MIGLKEFNSGRGDSTYTNIYAETIVQQRAYQPAKPIQSQIVKEQIL